MDSQQARILLEKINALQKSIGLDEGDISGIERDLMLSYIRQLYETYLHGDSNAARSNNNSVAARQTVAPPPPPAPLQGRPGTTTSTGCSTTSSASTRTGLSSSTRANTASTSTSCATQGSSQSSH
jgi:hypothetical protein